MPLAFTGDHWLNPVYLPYNPLIWSYTLFLQFRPFHTYLLLRCHHTSLELPTGSLYIFFFASTKVHDSSVTGLCVLFSAQSYQSLWHIFPCLILLGQKCSKLWQALDNHSFF